jgi:hypothetical protein
VYLQVGRCQRSTSLRRPYDAVASVIGGGASTPYTEYSNSSIFVAGLGWLRGSVAAIKAAQLKAQLGVKVLSGFLAFAFLCFQLICWIPSHMYHQTLHDIKKSGINSP